MLASKPVFPSLSNVLSPSDSASCCYPPSYRCNFEDDNEPSGSVWSRLRKQKLVPLSDSPAYETPEYSASFILPDFFDDDSFILEIEESDTTPHQNNSSKCRWRLPGIMANIFVFFRKNRTPSKK